MKTIKLSIAAIILTLSGISNSFAGGTGVDSENNLHPDMRLEQWMMVITEFETGFENELTFESWMMSQTRFMEKESRIIAETESMEKELQFEDWMLHYSTINPEFQDHELQLESWMTKIY